MEATLLPGSLDRLYTTKAPAAMRPSELLDQYREAIRQVVAAHRARNPRVFGPVIHGEDTEASDVDLLIDPGDGISLFDMGAIIADLMNRRA